MFSIGDKQIDRDDENCFIIAEIGQNHQGNIELAKEMILKAKECGADCVKFQKSCLTEKFTANALNRPYTTKNSFGKTYGEHKQYLEFSIEQFNILQSYANDCNILFTASAMDLQSFRQLAEDLLLPVPFIKIGSGDANNFELIEFACKKKYKTIPLIISTGMQNEYTIKMIQKLLANRTNWCLLHCVSSYPTDPINTNLRAIEWYRKWFPTVTIGYSGHEQSVSAISSVAYLLGAKIIERHFTMDKKQKGTDHCLSLEPHEFLEFTQTIRKLGEIKLYNPVRCSSPANTNNIINILNGIQFNDYDLVAIKQSLDGKNFDGKKRIIDCELECWQKLGKSLVYRRALKCNDRLTVNDMVMKVSDPKGLSSDYYYKIVGNQLRKNVYVDEPIQLDDFFF